MLHVFIALLIFQEPTLDQYLAAQKAFAANPHSEQRLVVLANILFERGQTERGIALVESFVKANPSAYRAQVLLASAYVQEEKYDAALALLKPVVQKYPNDYYAQHVMGLTLSGLNRIVEAESRFKRATELKPDYPESDFQLALLYARQPETLDQAYTLFQRALELGHPKPEIYKNLGSINIKRGQYDKAIEQLNAAIAADPNYSDAYFLLADALRKTGKAEEAAEATRRFQALNAAAADQRARSNKSQAAYEEGMALLFAKDMSFQI